ncbi:MAG: sugar transferase, partial [Bacteroidales bacterium]|nr:sugar transferase [Bacteroidales bacterium]
MNKKRLRLLYIIFDLLTSQIAWTLFFFFRKIVFEQKIFGGDLRIIPDNRLLTGLIVIPVFWLILNFIAGFYDNPFRKSRLRDLGLTFFIVLLGSIILFFALILDDFIKEYSNYYLSFGVLFGLQFTLSFIPRYILTSITVNRVH